MCPAAGLEPTSFPLGCAAICAIRVRAQPAENRYLCPSNNQILAIMVYSFVFSFDISPKSEETTPEEIYAAVAAATEYLDCLYGISRRCEPGAKNAQTLLDCTDRQGRRCVRCGTLFCLGRERATFLHRLLNNLEHSLRSEFPNVYIESNVGNY